MVAMNLRKALLGLSIPLALLAVAAGCGGQGDTDGGAGNDDAGLGPQIVSDGGSGSTLRIELEDATELEVAERTKFKVIATDPTGAPLSFIRIFCETESGIAILEPSRGGVAFEHTNTNGIMSGVLGGLTPGSYLIECRAPEGFNLLARLTLRVTGEVPAGFDGWPGAAGGNLGGGLIVDPTDEDFFIREILFVTVTGAETRNGPLDTSFDSDCNNDGVSTDPEPYGFDNYKLSLVNSLPQRVFINSITFSVDLGVSTVTGVSETGGLVVEPGTESELVDTFTEFVTGSSTKVFATTATALPTGTFNVTFTVRGTLENGDGFSSTQRASVTFGGVDNCS